MNAAQNIKKAALACMLMIGLSACASVGEVSYDTQDFTHAAAGAQTGLYVAPPLLSGMYD